MNNLSYEEEQCAKEDLKNAFHKMQWRHFDYASGRAELDYRGNYLIKNLLHDAKHDIDDLINHIENEERSCEDYLLQYCSKFYNSLQTSRTNNWSDCGYAKEETNALERIKKAVENIDRYAASRSQDLANSFSGGLKRRMDNFSTYGVARPWGAEIRQRMAVAANLKNEVENLWELGLNSIANSQHVYLGNSFIDLIRKDDATKKVIGEIETEIKSDILSKVHNVGTNVVNIDVFQFNGSKPIELGGKRHSDDMMKQLRFTLNNPIESAVKYADTWNVAMNELTWVLRHCKVYYTGVYHAVYNICGFGFIWELEFSIEDTLDLRPHSKDKIDFRDAYNKVTTILGMVYHDLLGNTDNLKVRVKWNDMGQSGQNGILPWGGLYYQ